MVDKSENINNSLSKLYLSGIMAGIMGITEVFMYDNMMNTTSWFYYLPLIVIVIFLIIMYRQQIGVNEKNYLNEMIEHHSMALLTSNSIIKKTNNGQIKNLAQNIIKSQRSEINYMNQLLKFL
jgi:uncharacterized protein (DUF305 family)